MIESGAVIETGWWVVAVILLIVAIAVALDPLFTRRRNDDPPKHARRAWSAKRLARRGEPTDAQLERWFGEDR